MDHVVPHAQGGLSTWENCVLACVPCNATKANRTPTQERMKLRKVPKKPSWKALAPLHPKERCESWGQFLTRGHWKVELEP